MTRRSSHLMAFGRRKKGKGAGCRSGQVHQIRGGGSVSYQFLFSTNGTKLDASKKLKGYSRERERAGRFGWPRG